MLRYGAPFVIILYLTDLAQKLLSLRIFSYLCAEITISARIYLYLRKESYLCARLAISAHCGKKLNDGKQPFLWSYHFAALFRLVLLGLSCTRLHRLCFFKIKGNDSLLLHFLKSHRSTSIVGRRPEHGTFTRASPPFLP